MRDWIFSSVASATARSSSPAAPPLQHRGDPCHAVCQESRACGDPGWPGRDRPGEVDQRTDPAPHPGDRGGDQGRAQGHQGDRRSSGTPPGLEQGRPEEERPPGLLHPTAGTGADHERDDREAQGQGRVGASTESTTPRRRVDGIREARGPQLWSGDDEPPRLRELGRAELPRGPGQLAPGAVCEVVPQPHRPPAGSQGPLQGGSGARDGSPGSQHPGAGNEH